VRALDPVWNRTRAVYLSRQALYVPGGATQAYRVSLPSHGRLETAIALIAPRGERATFRVLVDDTPVLETVLDGTTSWHRQSILIGNPFGDPAVRPSCEATVRFTVEGSAQVHGFFSDPLLYRSTTPDEERPTNLLFVVIDTLRADALPVMPHLSALAAHGARFDQAITAATWTRPSLLAMYGGDLPSAVGQSADQMIPEEADRRRLYRLAPPLLPHLLQEQGYRASAIGNNFFLLAYPAIGLDLGFEEVDDIRHPVLDTPAIARAAIRYLEDNRDRPFFLDLHFDAPHWPYTPPPEYLAGPRRAQLAAWQGEPGVRRDPEFARYLAEAAYADDYLGKVLDALARLGLAERTLVVVVGDHGEVFDPAHSHVVTALGQPTLHHHGWAAYDELLRVPLVMAWAGHIVPARIGAQVRLFDLPSTILDYLGMHASLPARGRSLRPLIEGHDEQERIAFVEGQNVRAVRGAGYLYLRRIDGRIVVDGKRRVVDEELYDLAADPADHVDVAGRDREALARMRALFAREAPVPPEVPEAVYHLVFARGPTPAVLDASLGAEGRVLVRGIRGGEATPEPGGLHVALRGGGAVDFSVEPDGAALHLALRRNGVPVPVDRVLAGPFAIPVLDGPLEGERLRRLDAERPPEPGERGDVLLYRDGERPGAAVIAAPTASATDEVRGMMERWGYAQPSHGK
jgi:arylsulfatase A-like enzyme